MSSRKDTRMMIDAAKWDPVAPLCMLKVIIYKFVQNDALRDSLMATFPKDIVEAAPLRLHMGRREIGIQYVQRGWLVEGGRHSDLECPR